MSSTVAAKTHKVVQLVHNLGPLGRRRSSHYGIARRQFALLVRIAISCRYVICTALTPRLVHIEIAALYTVGS